MPYENNPARGNMEIEPKGPSQTQKDCILDMDAVLLFL